MAPVYLWGVKLRICRLSRRPQLITVVSAAGHEAHDRKGLQTRRRFEPHVVRPLAETNQIEFLRNRTPARKHFRAALLRARWPRVPSPPLDYGPRWPVLWRSAIVGPKPQLTFALRKLSTRCRRYHFWVRRHVGINGCSMLRLRVNQKPSVD